MTNAAKNTVWEATWWPFGAALTLSGPASLDLRFPGQWFQLESGLHYNWHRHYDRGTGRYTQPDPLGFVDGPSVYAYADGSALVYVDEDGRLIQIAIGVAVGAGLDLMIQTMVEGRSLACVNWVRVGAAGAMGAAGGAAAGGAFKITAGSSKWANASRRYRRAHNVPRTHDAHHWAVRRNSRIGKWLPDWIKNHPVNLHPVERGIHERIHNGFDLSRRWWYGTPSWAKTAEGALGAGAAAELLDCGCPE